MAGVLGSLDRNWLYRQENPNQALSTLLSAANGMARAREGLTQTIDQFGKDYAAQKAARLLQDEDYIKANPQEALAKLMAVTDGRTINKQAQEMFKTSENDKMKIQKNNWDEEAATTKFQRALTRDRINNAAALMRTKEAYKNRNKALSILGLSKKEKDFKKNKYLETISITKDPKLRTQLVQEGFLNGLFDKNDRIGMERLGIVTTPSTQKSRFTKSQLSKLDGNKQLLMNLPEFAGAIITKDGNIEINGHTIDGTTAAKLVQELKNK